MKETPCTAFPFSGANAWEKGTALPAFTPLKGKEVGGVSPVSLTQSVLLSDYGHRPWAKSNADAPKPLRAIVPFGANLANLFLDEGKWPLERPPPPGGSSPQAAGMCALVSKLLFYQNLRWKQGFARGHLAVSALTSQKEKKKNVRLQTYFQ